MLNVIELNDKKIEKFNISSYLEKNNYQMSSALAALHTTNKIRIAFIKPEDGLDSSDYTLRLYALLQSLFVSIDSLYAIAYALTNSKSFININSNPDLRALKYIRNDVVGHPSNRVLSSDELAYCILDDKKISKEFFVYYIFTKEGKEEKKIYINDILKSYYLEANNLLDELYDIANANQNKTLIQEMILEVLKRFYEGSNYKIAFEKFIDEYKRQYPDSSKSQHRILWRYDLIKKLQNYKCHNNDVKEVVNHCIGLELTKIYELIYSYKFEMSINKRIPKLISSLYRMLNKNRELVAYLDYIKDSDHPLYKKVIIKLYDEAVIKKYSGASLYLKLILNAYNDNDLDLVYALALPIKEYKKK
ncbi:MAG: hypothetical protein ACI35S_04400 [Anaeroplasma sp.]